MEPKDAEVPKTISQKSGPQSPKISRRDFLKLGGAAIAGAAAGYAAQRLGLPESTHSPEIELKPSVSIE